MRSVPAHSFDRLTSIPSLWRAFLRCRRNKRRQPVMATFDLNADMHVLRLHRDLRDGSYEHGPFRLRVIHDPKTRLIAAAAVRDRVLHQSLIGELAPHYERGFCEDSYAVSQGRGPHRAVLRYLGFARKFRHRVSLDIRRYFPSIRHDRLLDLFARRLRPCDKDTLALLGHVLHWGSLVYRDPLAIAALGLADQPVPEGCGMAIGSYISQWCGALYLDGLDHHVKRVLKVPGYLRYMDDFVLFDDDEGRLGEARSAIQDWLSAERGLALNPKRWEIHRTSEPSTFLGYRVSRSGLAPGPKLRRRLHARLREAARRGPRTLYRCIQAYKGLFLF